MFSWQAKQKNPVQFHPLTVTNAALHSFDRATHSECHGKSRSCLGGSRRSNRTTWIQRGSWGKFPKQRGEASCQRVSKGLSSTHCSNMHLSFRSRPFISSAPDFVYESGWNRLSLAKLGLTVESDSQSCFAIWFFPPFSCFLLPSILHEALTNEWRGRGLKLTLRPRSHIGVHPRFHQWEHNYGIIDAELNADVRSSVTRIFKNNLIWKDVFTAEEKLYLKGAGSPFTHCKKEKHLCLC